MTQCPSGASEETCFLLPDFTPSMYTSMCLHLHLHHHHHLSRPSDFTSPQPRHPASVHLAFICHHSQIITLSLVHYCPQYYHPTQHLSTTNIGIIIIPLSRSTLTSSTSPSVHQRHEFHEFLTLYASQEASAVLGYLQLVRREQHPGTSENTPLFEKRRKEKYFKIAVL